jgi:hypothetical protein
MAAAKVGSWGRLSGGPDVAVAGGGFAVPRFR